MRNRLFSVYPMLNISETVYHEVVTSGLAIGAKDASEVDKFCRSKQVLISPSSEIREAFNNYRRYLSIHQSLNRTQKKDLHIRS